MSLTGSRAAISAVAFLSIALPSLALAADPLPLGDVEAFQAVPDWDGRVGHHEKIHDPPAPPRALVTSRRLPPAALTRNGFLSIQVNVDPNGDNIVG